MSEDQDIQKQIETLSDAVARLHATQVTHGKVLQMLVAAHPERAALKTVWQAVMRELRDEDLQRLRNNLLKPYQGASEQLYRHELDRWADFLARPSHPDPDAPSPGEDVR